LTGARIRGITSRATAVVIDIKERTSGPFTLFELVLEQRIGSFLADERVEVLAGIERDQPSRYVFFSRGTPTRLKVNQAGSGYKTGQIINIGGSAGHGALGIVQRTDANGGILDARMIRTGEGYGASTFASPIIGGNNRIDFSSVSGFFNTSEVADASINEPLVYDMYDQYTAGFRSTVFPFTLSPVGERLWVSIVLEKKSPDHTVSCLVEVINKNSGEDGSSRQFLFDPVDGTITETLSLNTVSYDIQDLGYAWQISWEEKATAELSGIRDASEIAIWPARAPRGSTTQDPTLTGSLKLYGIYVGSTLARIGSGASIEPVIGTVTRISERWKDASSIPSASDRLIDSYYYQAFSYVLESDIDYAEWNPTMTRVNHPSGAQPFGSRIRPTQETVLKGGHVETIATIV
jgi:hypothetical protein